MPAVPFGIDMICLAAADVPLQAVAHGARGAMPATYIFLGVFRVFPSSGTLATSALSVGLVISSGCSSWHRSHVIFIVTSRARMFSSQIWRRGTGFLLTFVVCYSQRLAPAYHNVNTFGVRRENAQNSAPENTPKRCPTFSSCLPGCSASLQTCGREHSAEC